MSEASLRNASANAIIRLTKLTKKGGTGMQVNIYEAKTRLSELIGLLEKEEEIVIAKSGKPVAKLVPYQNPQHRELGAWKGAFTVPEDFDDPDEEIAELFGV